MNRDDIKAQPPGNLSFVDWDDILFWDRGLFKSRHPSKITSYLSFCRLFSTMCICTYTVWGSICPTVFQIFPPVVNVKRKNINLPFWYRQVDSHSPWFWWLLELLWDVPWQLPSFVLFLLLILQIHAIERKSNQITYNYSLGLYRKLDIKRISKRKWFWLTIFLLKVLYA